MSAKCISKHGQIAELVFQKLNYNSLIHQAAKINLETNKSFLFKPTTFRPRALFRQCHIRYKQNCTALFYKEKEQLCRVSSVCHTPGLSGFGTTGSFGCCPCCLLSVFSTGSFFSLDIFVPDDFFMNNPSIVTFDSSALAVFFMLCLGVPKGDENWTESC